MWVVYFMSVTVKDCDGVMEMDFLSAIYLLVNTISLGRPSLKSVRSSLHMVIIL